MERQGVRLPKWVNVLLVIIAVGAVTAGICGIVLVIRPSSSASTTSSGAKSSVSGRLGPQQQARNGRVGSSALPNNGAVDDIVVDHFGLESFTGSFTACNCTSLELKAGQFSNSSSASVCFGADGQIGIKFEFEPGYCYKDITFAIVIDPSLIDSLYNAAPGQFPYKYTCESPNNGGFCCPVNAGSSVAPVYFQGTLPGSASSYNPLYIAIHEEVLFQPTQTGNTAWTRGAACQEFDHKWGGVCPAYKTCPQNPVCFYKAPVRTASPCQHVNGQCIGQYIIQCDPELSTDCALCNPDELLDLPCDECPQQCVQVCDGNPQPTCSPWSSWSPCGVNPVDVSCTGSRRRSRSCDNCPACEIEQLDPNGCQCPNCNYGPFEEGVCGADINPNNILCECFADFTSKCLPTSVPNCACNQGEEVVEQRPCDCSPICTSYRTYTQGGWGAVPKGNNPGSFLAQNFAINGYILIGKAVNGYKYLNFTTAKSIEDYLPSGGTPAKLTGSATYPDGMGNTPSGNNTFAGQLLAAKINVAMDAKVPSFNGNCPEGILDDLVFNISASSPLNACYNGWTVAAIIEYADQVISGMTVDNPLSSCDDPSTLTAVLDLFNKNFDNGVTVVPSVFVECI